ncbi:hypothetical protein ACFE04_015804 [Oxalis oulophora]
MESSAVDLPSDIIVEILSRASLKSLGKCRLLSNETNSLTYRSDFLNVHHQRTKTVRGFFVQGWNPNFVSTSEDENLFFTRQSLKYLPDDLLASTKQGILLYGKTDGRKRTYLVCKPCTRQYLPIPAPTLEDWGITEGIGLAVLRSNPLRFKIVLIIPSFSHMGRDIHVYDSDLMRWNWLPQRISMRSFDSDFRLMDWIPERIIVQSWLLRSNQVPVSASGALYWITSTNTIFSYNVLKENWRFIKSPNLRLGAYRSIFLTLVNYEGKLGITIQEAKDLIELWVYEKKLWTKRRSINIEPLIRKTIHEYTITGFCSSDVALVNFGEFFAFYNFKEGVVLKLEKQKVDPRHEVSPSISYSFNLRHKIFPFESDFERIDWMGRRGFGSSLYSKFLGWCRS